MSLFFLHLPQAYRHLILPLMNTQPENTPPPNPDPSQGASRQEVLARGIICVRALIESWQAEDGPLKRCIHPPQKGDNSERKKMAETPRGNLEGTVWAPKEEMMAERQ